MLSKFDGTRRGLGLGARLAGVWLMMVALSAGVESASAASPVAFNQTNSCPVFSECILYLPYSNPDGGIETFTLVSGAVRGEVRALDGQTWEYVPLVPGQPVSLPYWCYTSTNASTEVDSFTWSVSNGSSTSGVATMTMILTPTTNSVPVATTQSVSVVAGEVRRVLYLSYTHQDWSQPVRFIITGAPAHGTLEYYDSGTSSYVAVPVNTPMANSSFFYTPAAGGYVGLDGFTWMISDQISTSAVVSYTVSIASNTPPRALMIRAATPPGTGVTMNASFSDPDTLQTMSACVVRNAGHGSVTAAGTTLTYTPAEGFKGVDSFEYSVSDGVAEGASATGTVMVRERNERGGALVELIVNNLLLPVVSNEVYRLKADLVNEGYQARVVSHTNSGSSASNLWAYLHAGYENTNQFLVGAILIGDLPKAQLTSCDGTFYSDLVYWNMGCFQTAADLAAPKNIWVSRINADDTTYGAQEILIRRALEANHNYRAGISRLPHTAYVFDCYTSTPDYATMLDVWPQVRVGGGGDHYVTFKFMPERPDVPYGACDCFVAGGEIFNETSHGSAWGYMENSWFNREGLLRTIAQQRVLLCCSCSSGEFGGIANNHLFTRGGGLLLAVGGTAINYYHDFTINGSTGVDARFRTLLKAGESYGGAAIQQFAFDSYRDDRTVFYGDLSVGVMASPSNSMPVITSLTADKTSILPGETVNFSFAFADPDTGVTNSPFVDYDHQVEWFPAGYDNGRAAPVCVTNSQGGSGGGTLSYTYNTAGRYVARVEVTDEWQARVWKDVTIDVNAWPVAGNDVVTMPMNKSVAIAVLGNDYDTGGLALYLQDCTQPQHGASLRSSGTSITYAPATNWFGIDSFTYRISNYPFYNMTTGTVTVVVTNGLGVLADTNADGIADLWTEQFFPVDFQARPATNDADGDGISNFLEYIAGTDPTNRADQFLVTVTYSNGLPVVSFTARATLTNSYGALVRHYAMECLSNLMSTNWVVVPGYGDMPAGGQAVRFSSSTATSRFFRAKAWIE